MLRALYILTAVLLFLAACKSSQSPVKPKDNLPLVSLETTSCFGFCPVYTLTVFNDGKVKYDGRQFVEKEGEVEFQLTNEELKELKALVKKTNLMQYPDRMETNVADAPWATLSVYTADSVKSVHGSIDRPEPLLALERQLKDLGKAHGLELRKGVNPNSPGQINKRKLIILLEENINAGNWMMQFDDIKMELVRRLGAENRWVISYDAAEIGTNALTQRLWDTKGVLDVQPGPASNNNKN